MEENTNVTQPEENVSSDNGQQPQAAAPKKDLKVTLSTISTILAIIAGFCGVAFMCCLGVSMTVSGGGERVSESIYLKDIINLFSTANDQLTSAGGSSANPTLYNQVVTHAFAFLYCLAFIIVGLIFGILLILKTLKYFKNKDNKEIKIEKFATGCFMLFVGAAIVMRSFYLEKVKGEGYKIAANYAGATLAGLIIGGICFGAYVLLKLYVNKDKYLGNKKILANASYNLAWAVLTVVFLILVACGPIMFDAPGAKATASFFSVFTDSFAQMDAIGSGAPEEYGLAMSMSFLGLAVQIWLIFQSCKALQGAVERTFDGTKPVSLASQIFRVVLSFFFMIFAIVAANNYATISGMDARYVSHIISIFVLVFGVISFTLAIVHKIMFKNYKVDPAEVQQATVAATSEQAQGNSEATQEVASSDATSSESDGASSSSNDDDFGTFTF